MLQQNALFTRESWMARNIIKYRVKATGNRRDDQPRSSVPPPTRYDGGDITQYVMCAMHAAAGVRRVHDIIAPVNFIFNDTQMRGH